MKNQFPLLFYLQQHENSRIQLTEFKQKNKHSRITSNDDEFIRYG